MMLSPFLLGAFILIFNTPPALCQRDIETCNPGTFRKGLACVPCPAGTFSDSFNTLNCTQCDPGTFRSKERASSAEQCLYCPAGFAAPDAGSKKCTKCKKGLDSVPGSRFCGTCKPGTGLTRGEPACQPCIRAFFSDASTKNVCKRCPDGTFTDGGSQPFPTTTVGATKCDKCPPGTYRRNSEFDFNPVSVFLSNRCTACQKGTFSDVAGAKSCKRCPPGTFAETGATGCTPCPKDTASNRLYVTKCRGCRKGLITIGKGAAVCKHPERGCTFDTFEDKSGQCKACLPGERLDAAKKICIPCAKNEISNGGVETKCKKCPRDKVPLTDVTLEEKAECFCKPGLVNDGKGGCFPCPAGTFWVNGFSFFLSVDNFKRGEAAFSLEGECESCPPGTFSDKSGQTLCTKCPVNTFQELEGGTSCKRCPAGSRNRRLPADDEETDRESCITDEFACAPGQIRNSAGKCMDVSCPLEGSVLRDNKCVGPCAKGRILRGNKCAFCGAESTSPGGLTGKCTKCPKNQESNDMGDKCICDGNFGLMNGKCVECPIGTQLVDVINQSSKCQACPEGTASRAIGGFGECEPCRRVFFTPNTGAIRCTRCPKGTTRFPNLFGELTNTCRPRDPYA